MSKYRKGVLYVRRLKKGDKTESWRTAARLAFYHQMIDNGRYRSAYVLVRHGFPDVMEVDQRKHDLQKRLMFSGGGSFKQGARRWKVKP